MSQKTSQAKLKIIVLKQHQNIDLMSPYRIALQKQLLKNKETINFLSSLLSCSQIRSSTKIRKLRNIEHLKTDDSFP